MGKSFLHLIRYLLGLDSAQSQTTVAEREALTRHGAGRRCVAEIGVFEGLTSGLLARAMSAGGILYCIDPFFPGRLGICWGKIIARREIASVRPGPRIVYVEKLSQEVLGSSPSRTKCSNTFIIGSSIDAKAKAENVRAERWNRIPPFVPRFLT
jgi:hypothetical protein